MKRAPSACLLLVMIVAAPAICVPAVPLSIPIVPVPPFARASPHIERAMVVVAWSSGETRTGVVIRSSADESRILTVAPKRTDASSTVYLNRMLTVRGGNPFAMDAGHYVQRAQGIATTHTARRASLVVLYIPVGNLYTVQFLSRPRDVDTVFHSFLAPDPRDPASFASTAAAMEYQSTAPDRATPRSRVPISETMTGGVAVDPGTLAVLGFVDWIDAQGGRPVIHLVPFPALAAAFSRDDFETISIDGTPSPVWGADALIVVDAGAASPLMRRATRSLQESLYGAIRAARPGVTFVSAPADVSQLYRSCDLARTVGVLFWHVEVAPQALEPLPADPSRFRRADTIRVRVSLEDCSAYIHEMETESATASFDQDVGPELPALEQAYTAAFHDIGVRLDRDLRAFLTADPTWTDHFFRYGMPVSGPSALFTLVVDPAVSLPLVNAYNFGTAARAGLREGMEASTLNGRPLRNLSRDAVRQLLRDAGGTYDVMVRNDDGSSSEFRFVAKDLLWYLTHRSSW